MQPMVLDWSVAKMEVAAVRAMSAGGQKCGARGVASPSSSDDSSNPSPSVEGEAFALTSLN